MLIKIEFDSEVPIYEQLRRQIIIGIAKGELEPGEKLPSVRHLGEELGINLHTVRKTYNILKDEGYLIIDRRSGAMVREDFRKGRENFKENINKELKYLTANAKNRGVSEEEFLKLCSKYYDKYKEG